MSGHWGVPSKDAGSLGSSWTGETPVLRLLRLQDFLLPQVARIFLQSPPWPLLVSPRGLVESTLLEKPRATERTSQLS